MAQSSKGMGQVCHSFIVHALVTILLAGIFPKLWTFRRYLFILQVSFIISNIYNASCIVCQPWMEAGCLVHLQGFRGHPVPVASGTRLTWVVTATSLQSWEVQYLVMWSFYERDILRVDPCVSWVLWSTSVGIEPWLSLTCSGRSMHGGMWHLLTLWTPLDGQRLWLGISHKGHWPPVIGDPCKLVIEHFLWWR